MSQAGRSRRTIAKTVRPESARGANFADISQPEQALAPESAELNGQKSRSWSWSKKRRLIPPALRAAKRPRGAPLGNKNALKHGAYTRERQAMLAGLARSEGAVAAAIRVLEYLENRPQTASRRNAIIYKLHLLTQLTGDSNSNPDAQPGAQASNGRPRSATPPGV